MATASQQFVSPVPRPQGWCLTPQEREEVSTSITQTWTEQAIRCYMTGADCANCDIPKGNYSFVCQMDKVVPVLLETLGQPDPRSVQKLYPQGLYPWAVKTRHGNQANPSQTAPAVDPVLAEVALSLSLT